MERVSTPVRRRYVKVGTQIVVGHCLACRDCHGVGYLRVVFRHPNFFRLADAAYGSTNAPRPKRSCGTGRPDCLTCERKEAGFRREQSLKSRGTTATSGRLELLGNG